MTNMAMTGLQNCNLIMPIPSSLTYYTIIINPYYYYFYHSISSKCLENHVILCEDRNKHKLKKKS